MFRSAETSIRFYRFRDTYIIFSRNRRVSEEYLRVFIIHVFITIPHNVKVYAISSIEDPSIKKKKKKKKKHSVHQLSHRVISFLLSNFFSAYGSLRVEQRTGFGRCAGGIGGLEDAEHRY